MLVNVHVSVNERSSFVYTQLIFLTFINSHKSERSRDSKWTLTLINTHVYVGRNL